MSGRAFANFFPNHYSIQKTKMDEIRNKTSEFLSQNLDQDKLSIAILDSGIDKDNTVFTGFEIRYYDCVEEKDENGQVIPPDTDPCGHGTDVTGIICNLLKQVKHKIKIYIIKTTDKDTNVNFSCLKKAYDLLETRPELQDVFLICQASGFDKKPDPDYNLKNEITEKKSLICSASNEGNWKPDTIAWPANEAVAVGSHDENAKPSGCSPRGQHLWVLAPGEYGELKGTSYAAAWVTALLAHFHLQQPHRYPGNTRCL